VRKHGVAVVVVQVARVGRSRPRVAVAVYPVTGDPPSESGGLQFTSMVFGLRGVATTDVGAEGAFSRGVRALAGSAKTSTDSTTPTTTAIRPDRLDMCPPPKCELGKMRAPARMNVTHSTPGSKEHLLRRQTLPTLFARWHGRLMLRRTAGLALNG
jgi:hypothetical protein